MEDDVGRCVRTPSQLRPVHQRPRHPQRRRMRRPRHQLTRDLDERSLGVARSARAAQARPRPSGGRARPIDPPAPVTSTVSPPDTRPPTRLELDRLATEHVLDLDLAKLARELEIVRDQLVDRGQRLDGDAGSRQTVTMSGPRLAGRGRDRDDDLVGAWRPDHLRQLESSRHLHPVEPQPPLARSSSTIRSACNRGSGPCATSP